MFYGYSEVKSGGVDMNETEEEVRAIFDIHEFEPVEDKPGYVWFNKRNFQIISIETLRKAVEDWQIKQLSDRGE